MAIIHACAVVGSKVGAHQIAAMSWNKWCCRAKVKQLRHTLTEEDIHALAAAAHGFVGADLAAICNEAAMAALRRHIKTAGGDAESTAAHDTTARQSAGLKKQSPGSTIFASPANNTHSSGAVTALRTPRDPVPASQNTGSVIMQESVTQQPASQNLADNMHDSSSLALATPTPHQQDRYQQQEASQQRCTEDTPAASVDENAIPLIKQAEQDQTAALRVTLADFRVAETRVQPSAMREVGLEV